MYGVYINIQKSKVMKVSKLPDSFVEIKRLQNFDQFKYLVSILTNDGYITKEIMSRITMAKIVFTKKERSTAKKIEQILLEQGFVLTRDMDIKEKGEKNTWVVFKCDNTEELKKNNVDQFGKQTKRF